MFLITNFKIKKRFMKRTIYVTIMKPKFGACESLRVANLTINLRIPLTYFYKDIRLKQIGVFFLTRANLVSI